MTLWTAATQASLSFTISWSLLKLMSIELVMPSNHLILIYPLLLLPSIFPSIGIFSSESALRIRWPKYWSFSISPFSICFDYTDLLLAKCYLCILVCSQFCHRFSSKEQVSFNFMSAVILESKKIKSVTVFSFSPSILTLRNLNYFSKVLFLSTIILGLITSIHKLGVGDAFSSQRKEKEENMNERRKEVI